MKKWKFEFDVQSMDGALYGKEENIKAYAEQYPSITKDYVCPMYTDGIRRCSTCRYNESNFAYKVDICVY